MGKYLKKIIIYIYILFIIFILIINTNFFKSFFIPSVMTTMKHKYLAYLLYDEKTINQVMSKNYIKYSNEKVKLEEINFNDKIITNKYDIEIYDKDKNNDVYKIINIKTNKYRGYLTVIYDSKDISLAIPKDIGKRGENVVDLCRENGGIVGINGGGFSDLEGFGNGAIPYGSIIKDGKLVFEDKKGTYSFIGFTNDNKLWLTNDTSKEVIKNGMRNAIEFYPFLIINGKSVKIYGNGGWGIAPRTAIAQRKDGIVLFLVIEGRIKESLGATLQDVIKILKRYGAYNAANLDGGASSTMSVNNKLYNKPSAGGNNGGRKISNAFIVTNEKNKKCEGCTYK